MKLYTVILILALAVGGALIRGLGERERNIATLELRNRALEASLGAALVTGRITGEILAEREKERHDDESKLDTEVRALESARLEETVRDWAGYRLPDSVLRVLREDAGNGEGGDDSPPAAAHPGHPGSLAGGGYQWGFGALGPGTAGRAALGQSR